MSPNSLTEAIFKATTEGKMSNVTQQPGHCIDIWPYVRQLQESIQLPRNVLDDRVVEYVYRSQFNHYDHVLIPSAKNVFLVIVVDRIQASVYGHRIHLIRNVVTKFLETSTTRKPKIGDIALRTDFNRKSPIVNPLNQPLQHARQSLEAAMQRSPCNRLLRFNAVARDHYSFAGCQSIGAGAPDKSIVCQTIFFRSTLCGNRHWRQTDRSIGR